MGPLAVHPGDLAVVEAVADQLHQGVGQAALPAALVVGALLPGQRLECGAQGGPGHQVELATQGHRGALAAGGELEPAEGDVTVLLVEVLLGVGSVTCVGAVEAEAADAVLDGLLKQGCLLEAAGGTPDMGRGAGQRARWP